MFVRVSPSPLLGQPPDTTNAPVWAHSSCLVIVHMKYAPNWVRISCSALSLRPDANDHAIWRVRLRCPPPPSSEHHQTRRTCPFRRIRRVWWCLVFVNSPPTSFNTSSTKNAPGLGAFLVLLSILLTRHDEHTLLGAFFMSCLFQHLS